MNSFKPYLHLEAITSSSFSLTIRIPFEPTSTEPGSLTVAAPDPSEPVRLITATFSPNPNPGPVPCPAFYDPTINAESYETGVRVEVYSSTDPNECLGFVEMEFAAVSTSDPQDIQPCAFLGLKNATYELGVLTPVASTQNVSFLNPPYGTLSGSVRTFEIDVLDNQSGPSCDLGNTDIAIPESQVGNNEDWVVLVKEKSKFKGKVMPNLKEPDAD